MVNRSLKYYKQFAEFMGRGAVDEALSLYQRHPDLISEVMKTFAGYYVTIEDKLGEQRAQEFLESGLVRLAESCYKGRNTHLVLERIREFVRNHRPSMHAPLTL